MKPVAWSYSSLTNYEQCPKKFYRTKVKKDIPDPMGKAALWGTRVHKDLELRIKDKTPLPFGVTKYESLCAKIESSPGRVFTETQYALTSSFKQTSWFAKDVWVRCIVDVGVNNGANALILDWKTGKIKPQSDQLKLFAAVTFHTEPEVEKVSTGFVWLKDSKIVKENYTRAQLPEIWQEFMPRVRRLEIAHEENKWEAKPSGLCGKWCPVTSCEHNGRRK
jgi:hypothetical protein